MTKIVISAARNFLAHTPGLVKYGSKPVREIATNASQGEVIEAHLRPYERAASYLPNRAYLGSVKPSSLAGIERPWYTLGGESPRRGPFGEIMPEDEFYGVMKAMDVFDLLWLEEGFAAEVRQKLLGQGMWPAKELKNLEKGVPAAQLEGQVKPGSGNLPLVLPGGRFVGVVNRAHDQDDTLFASVLMENLACKAAATMATKSLLTDTGTDPATVPYVLNSGEEAVGDRYQRGGGNMAKAVAEGSGLVNASGADVKAFCCGPNHAIILAGGLISAGVFDRVMVVGGCSLAKLGMKYQGHVKAKMPILEDVLAGSAIMVEKDDGKSPVVRMDAVGIHTVGAGGSQANIIEELVTKPLAKMGLKFRDVDKYATEMHNPEVTEPAGSGNVPELNYKLIAALASRAGEIQRSEMPAFAAAHGMAGFSPTQGHIASAIPFMPHAVDGIMKGEMERVMFMAKGSLFLGRMTQMSDGLSFMIEGQS
jgi:glycine/sarcosine/betaine reductase complex component C subunit beta